MRNIIKFAKAFKRNFSVFGGLAVLFAFPALITGMAVEIAVGFIIACLVVNGIIAYLTMNNEK